MKQVSFIFLSKSLIETHTYSLFRISCFKQSFPVFVP